jgi:hypothetical protein
MEYYYGKHIMENCHSKKAKKVNSFQSVINSQKSLSYEKQYQRITYMINVNILIQILFVVKIFEKSTQSCDFRHSYH